MTRRAFRSDAVAGFRRDARGASAVEFALLAPLVILMLVGIIETGRLLWTQHSLDQVAAATARCTAVTAACDTTESQQAHAVREAGELGVTIAADDVEAGVGSCRTVDGSARVAITTGFASPVGAWVPGFPDSLAAEACFPRMAGD